MQGNTVWFNEKKGYGFIKGEDGKEYFVHFVNIIGEGFKKLVKDELVEFKPSEGDKGLIALDIEKIL